MRILVQHGDKLYRFVNIDVVNRDGSLIVTVRREGTNTFGFKWTSQDDGPPVREDFPVPCKKDKRITIHTSGRINFRENPGSQPIFIEPLNSISVPFVFYGYRIPKISALSGFNERPESDDAIFDLSALNDAPQSFDFVLSPANFVPAGHAVKLEFLSKFSLVIVRKEVSYAMPADLEGCFTTFAVQAGLFSDQQIPEDVALISHHQALQDTKGMILYSPNSNGEWKIITAVQMRISPKVDISLFDPDLYVDVVDQTLDARVSRVQVKFFVRKTQTKEIVKNIVQFKSIELCARF